MIKENPTNPSCDAEDSTSDKKRILIVDDDESVRDLVSEGLIARGIDVIEAVNGQEGLEAALAKQPDLVLLDILMPGMDGLTMCQRLRRRSTVPILFLSSRDEERHIVEGLGIGGDDYITKPFRIGELVARVEAILRRANEYHGPSSGPVVFGFGDVVINFTSLRATRGGRELALTPTEFRILHHFWQHPGGVVTRDDLLREIWGDSPEGVLTRTVDTHIARLRRKIEPSSDEPRYIQTIQGVGYRMLLDDDSDDA